MKNISVLRRGVASLFIALVLASHGSVGFAWGYTGHIIVGDIAEHYLTATAREQVHALLSADGSASLGAISTWADEIKSDRPETKLWHYVDIPLCGKADRDTYCPNGQCVTEQIKRFTEVLGDQNASPSKRIEALKFLTHLVADVHQPLHAEDNQDRGGNDIHVTFYAEPKTTLNLHAIWDTDMIQQFVRDPSVEAHVLIKRISPRDIKVWSTSAVDDWAAQSHELALKIAYGDLPGGYACGQPDPDNLAIGRKYYREAKPIIEMQLDRAGVRLAALLNRTLDESKKNLNTD